MAANYMVLNRLLTEQIRITASTIGVYDHPTAKGDGREDLIRQVLGERIGTMFGISKAEVVDSNGHSTNEIDAVLYDQSIASCLHALGYRRIVRVEAVAATIEIKTRLDRREVERTIAALHGGQLQLTRFYKPAAAAVAFFGHSADDWSGPNAKLTTGLSTASDYKEIGRIANAIFAYQGPSIDEATSYLQNPLIDMICVLDQYTLAKRGIPFQSMEANPIIEWGVGLDSLGAFLQLLEGVLQSFRTSRFWIRPDITRYYKPPTTSS